MSFVRNVSGLLLTSVVSIPIAFASSVLLARFLSVEDRGAYALLVTFATVAVIFSQLGWPAATIFRLRRVQTPPARVAASGILVVLTLSALTVGLCVALRPDLTERFLGETPATLFFLAVAMVPVQLLSLLFGSLARGIDRFVVQNIYKLLLGLSTLAAMTYVLVHRGGGILEVMMASLAVQALGVLGYLVAILRETGFSLRVDWKEIRESLVFGLKSYLQALAGQVHQRVDLFMIAYFLQDTKQVAFYAIAAGLVQQLMIIPESVGGAAYPQLAGLRAREGAQFVARVSRQSVLWVLLAALSFGAVAPLFVPLVYGEAYAASVAPLLVLLPAIVLIAIYRVLSRFFTAQDRQQANMVTQVVSVLVNLILNFLWIPQYGILGAAAASLVSYGLEALLISAVFVRLTRTRPSEFLVAGRDDLAEILTRVRAAAERLRRSGP